MPQHGQQTTLNAIMLCVVKLNIFYCFGVPVFGAAFL